MLTAPVSRELTDEDYTIMRFIRVGIASVPALRGHEMSILATRACGDGCISFEEYLESIVSCVSPDFRTYYNEWLKTRDTLVLPKWNKKAKLIFQTMMWGSRDPQAH